MKNQPKTALQWFLELHKVCQFQTVEQANTSNKNKNKDKPTTGPASNSEVRRWLEQGAVVINGEKLTKDELMDFPISSVVLFPKSTIRRTTLN